MDDTSPAIQVIGLSKNFKVHEKPRGFRNSVKALFHRTFNTVTAVKDLHFSVQKGEMLGLLGANGAGKTTTLKLLSGLLYPSYGALTVLGESPQLRKDTFLKNISLIMGQKFQLSWDLTPADSLLVNKSLYEIPDKDFQQRLHNLTDLLRAEHVLNKPTRKLSLGERMKCELIAALIHQPKLLFLDEPTIGLDLETQYAIRSFLKDYNAATGATIILTSH